VVRERECGCGCVDGMDVAYESGSSEVVVRLKGLGGGWIGVNDGVRFCNRTVSF
jgi:hypothetical protein